LFTFDKDYAKGSLDCMSFKKTKTFVANRHKNDCEVASAGAIYDVISIMRTQISENGLLLTLSEF